MDNRRENIEFLCRAHHMAAHKVLDKMVGGGVRPRVNALQRERAMRKYAIARDMLESGVDIRVVARALGVVPLSIYRWRRKYDV